MKKKRSGQIWWWLSILVIAIAAILAGYYMGMERGFQMGEVPDTQTRVIKTTNKTPQTDRTEPKAEESEPVREENENVVVMQIEEPPEKAPVDRIDDCELIDKEIRAFFQYLDQKDYIQHIQADMDTYERFASLLRKIASTPPIPAGEGIDNKIMTQNIYHFFRVLNKADIRLIRAALRHEADTLELNMELFFRWLSSAERCPDPEGLRPSMAVQYRYAGFFLNTIGGRAYLFRRPAALRLLIGYYALLLIHEADKKGMNSYGIDIFPLVASIREGIKHYPDFHFQRDYLRRLTEIQNHYRNKR
jgi:hypothetical protein